MHLFFSPFAHLSAAPRGASGRTAAPPTLSSNYAAIKLAHGSAPSPAAPHPAPPLPGPRGSNRKKKGRGKRKRKRKGKQPNGRPSPEQPEQNQNLLHPKGDEGERAGGVFGSCCTSPVRPSAPEGSGCGSQDQTGPDTAAGTGQRPPTGTSGHRAPVATHGHRTWAAGPDSGTSRSLCLFLLLPAFLPLSLSYFLYFPLVFSPE